MKEAILIINPVGIDKAIQEMQNYLLTSLSWIEKTFGRAYKRDSKPFVYRKNKEYQEIFANDKSNAFCFFAVDTDIQNGIDVNTNFIFNQTTNVSIIFFVDLKKCFNLQHRGDENAIIEVIDAINKFNNKYGVWKLNRILKTAERVYNQFNYTFPESLIDDEPYTVFSFEFELTYKNNTTC